MRHATLCKFSGTFHSYVMLHYCKFSGTFHSCVVPRYCKFSGTFHSYVMLRYCKFSGTFHSYVMLRYCKFSGTFDSCVMPRYCKLSGSFHSYVMLRSNIAGTQTLDRSWKFLNDFLPAHMVLKHKDRGHSTMHPSVTQCVHVVLALYLKQSRSAKVLGRTRSVAVTNTGIKTCQVEYFENSHKPQKW